MAFDQELDVYLRARFTLMILVTTEEERAMQTVKAICEKTKRSCLTWDLADGFQLLAGGSPLPSARDPLSALEQVDKLEADVLFVLKDFHDCWGNNQIKRKLRSVAQRLKFTKKSILVTAPSSKLPEELKDEAVVIEFAPPNAAELEAVLNRLTQTPGVKVNLTKLGREKLVQAALGLTASQAGRVFAKAIVSDGVLDDRDIDLVTQEKKEIIRESEALEFYPVTETVDDVGGLGVLKEWLRLRERAFTKEARDYGLPSPKGIALIGIPGCVRGDTRVLLADGRMPTIESLARLCTETLEPGVYPIALDVVGADGQSKRATELHVYADQLTVIVRLAAGHEIEVTREHPLLTERGWQWATDLREGDKIALHLGHPVERCQPNQNYSPVVSLQASWQARVYDLHVPDGHAFVANGIINHNTGKSLTAKMIGGLWRLPLLRLDVGALFGSLVGEAEERTRRALRLAETVAPAILWIDEMEKALAHGGGDSGTSTRVFGTILTWTQEKTSPVFVVGTANNIASLPPEVLRKGRFDEIFFLDLPTLEERKEIFTVHLRKRNRLPQDFDIARLARESEGYVGAEIEQAIIDAMYVGFNARREFNSDDISAALKRQVPLSVSQREIIGALRNWLREGRAQSASFQEIREAEQQFVPLQLEIK